MNTTLLILGLLMPSGSIKPSQNTTSVVTPSPVTPNEVKPPAKIRVGMTPDQLVKAFGQPSHIEHETNFYSGVEFDRYFFEDEPCLYHFQSCMVDVASGKVVALKDVKPERVER